jgi:trans-aconitate methyltransferase
VQRVSLSSDAAVLDLACGTGDFYQLLLERLPRARVVEADLTEPAARRPQARNALEREKVVQNGNLSADADEWS